MDSDKEGNEVIDGNKFRKEERLEGCSGSGRGLRVACCRWFGEEIELKQSFASIFVCFLRIFIPSRAALSLPIPI